MSPRKQSKKIPPAKRRELEIAAAVARETVMQAHLSKALRAIELAGDRVSAVRMLSIYARVHSLAPADSEVLTSRVLAQLGTRSRKGDAPTVFLEEEEDNPRESGSLLRVVRDRLRGRIHHDLRRWVELHTGATQVALLDIHVRHALGFVKELNATHTIDAALDVYRELTGLVGPVSDALYMFVLDSLASEELPKKASTKAERDQQVSLFPQEVRRAKQVV
jgi:hypothetical protein